MKKSIFAAALAAVTAVTLVGCKEKTTSETSQSDLDVFDQMREVSTFKDTGNLQLGVTAVNGNTKADINLAMDIAKNGLRISQAKVSSAPVTTTSDASTGDTTLEMSDLIMTDSGIFIPIGTYADLSSQLTGQTMDEATLKQQFGDVKYVKFGVQDAAALAGSTTSTDVNISSSTLSKVKNVCSTSVVPVLKEKFSSLKDKIITTKGTVSTVTLNKDTAPQVIDKLIEMYDDGTLDKIKADFEKALDDTSDTASAPSSRSADENTLNITSATTNYRDSLVKLKEDISKANQYDITITSSLSTGSAEKSIAYDIKATIDLGEATSDYAVSTMESTKSTLNISIIFAEGDPTITVPAEEEAYNIAAAMNNTGSQDNSQLGTVATDEQFN